MSPLPRLRLLVLSLLLPTLGGCSAVLAGSGGGSQPQQTAELSGTYVLGPGASWFQACDAPAEEEPWWVTVTDDAAAEVERARRAGVIRDDRPVFVRWRAAVVRDGRIGPRGRGAPALLVREVLELRLPGEADCATSPRPRAGGTAPGRGASAPHAPSFQFHHLSRSGSGSGVEAK